MSIDEARQPSDGDDLPARTPEEEPPHDGSTMMGVSGVEAEVLAEAARAEAELSDPTAPPPDDEGAQV